MGALKLTDLSSNPHFRTLVDEWRLLGQPKQNGMDWQLEPWVEKFPSQVNFLEQLSFANLGILDRELVYETVHLEIEKGDYLNAFLAVMIWGYANDSRGPYRADEIVSQSNFLNSIKSATELIQNRKIEEAFEALITNGPKHLGTAFGTKYLHFASDKTDHLRPVILDSLVAKGLSKWSDFEINPITAKAEDYVTYLRYLKKHSIDLGLTIEQLEFLLFTETARFKGNQSWANRPNRIEISRQDQMAWGMLFASELMMRDKDLWLSFSQPGGGQYQCITLRKVLDNLVIYLNLLGDIVITGEHNLRFSWENLIEKGVANTAERLTINWGSEAPKIRPKQSLAPWATRNIADWLITGQAIDVRPIVSDNSYTGVKVDSESLEPFKDLLTISERPKQSIYPSENWLWLIVFEGGEKKLYDLINAEVLSLPDSKKQYFWI